MCVPTATLTRRFLCAGTCTVSVQLVADERQRARGWLDQNGLQLMSVRDVDFTCRKSSCQLEVRAELQSFAALIHLSIGVY
jgi:hypothetical protein